MRRWRMVDDWEEEQDEGYRWLTERGQNTCLSHDGLQPLFSLTHSLLHFTFPLSGKDSEDPEDVDDEKTDHASVSAAAAAAASSVVRRSYAKNRPMIE